MDQAFIVAVVAYLQSLSAEITSVIQFITCALAILVLLRSFQLLGLYLYASLATIIANLQVLKVSLFSLSPEPVALGTIVFASIFLVTEIITEHYGKEAAKRCIGVCFATQVVMTVMMVITLGFPPVAGDANHLAMETLFLPAPRLLFASIVAFVASQRLEIYLFKLIKDKTQGRYLWLRTNVATIIAAVVDNVLFSVLAWQILAPLPVSTTTLIYTYILPTYIARVLVSFAATPVIYFSYACVRRAP